MTLERILKAAVASMITGHHVPHCYSAHVVGEGYVNKGDGTTARHDRADYLRQLEQTATSEVENLGYAPSYAEPGYTNPEKGVIWANWNNLPRDLDRVLERAGYAVEWSDEWANCDDCQRAVRTSPDSYGYQPYYVFVDDCTIVCLDCVDWAEYLESIEDDATKAVVRKCNPADYGYTRISDAGEYESGFHAGQTDDPRKVLADLQSRGHSHIVFRIPETSQFYIKFEVWEKRSDDDDTTEEEQ